LRSAVKAKLQLVVATRERWPTYASLREDEDLRKASWNAMFKDVRVRMIMHDMTDVPLPHPSDAELNRATYSKYYGGNCGKGGIFTQPCGWEGTLELFTGSVGDSDYVRSSKMLEHQEEYQNSDPQIDGSIIPFTNVYDKGYRVILDFVRHGKQLCWQPVCARSDRRYGTFSTLLTAVVAYTRSGNERSVKHVKHSWLIVRGCGTGQSFDLDFVADMWLAWGFQINFMYDPVH
jgi:hypothetical protein